MSNQTTEQAGSEELPESEFMSDAEASARDDVDSDEVLDNDDGEEE